jgi:uncharacterized surface protein with fasciclin (FAS1) repeats
MAKLLKTLSDFDEFTILLEAIKAAELEETLDSDGFFTILAPTNDAFSQNTENTIDSLLQNIPKLKRVLLYHVLSGDVRSDDLTQIDEAPTLEGSIIGVSHSGEEVRVNNALVTKLDIMADNGVVHRIDTVLAPAIIAHEYD